MPSPKPAARGSHGGAAGKPHAAPRRRATIERPTDRSERDAFAALVRPRRGLGSRVERAAGRVGEGGERPFRRDVRKETPSVAFRRAAEQAACRCMKWAVPCEVGSA
ncbi:unnamed protein product [Lampetra fluviatilis]